MGVQAELTTIEKRHRSETAEKEEVPGESGSGWGVGVGGGETSLSHIKGGSVMPGTSS